MGDVLIVGFSLVSCLFGYAVAGAAIDRLSDRNIARLTAALNLHIDNTASQR